MDVKQAIILRQDLANKIIERVRKYGAVGYETDAALEAVRLIIYLRTGIDSIISRADYEAAIGILNDILPEEIL